MEKASRRATERSQIREAEERPKSLGRNNWLAAALYVLAAEGVAGVRVEKLARLLGVTKGSFYWHFKNRKALLRSLLDYWVEEMTDSVSRFVERIGGDPRSRLLALLEHIEFEGRNRYDPAMRAWAAFDETAAAVVKEVDERRLRLVTQIFRDMGFSDTEAALRGRMSYYYLVGEATVLIQDSPADHWEFLRLRHRLLTHPI
ncbi:MAG: TetR/AcrR family transcriptional regulator [Gemmatimonadota bacterium]